MFVQIFTTNFKIIICAIDGEIGNYQTKVTQLYNANVALVGNWY